MQTVRDGSSEVKSPVVDTPKEKIETIE